MKPTSWLRLGLTGVLAGLLVLVLLSSVSASPVAPHAITFDLAPVPPRSIIPGMAQSFTWTITGGTPDRVEFWVKDPGDNVVDVYTYTGSSGLNIARPYTVPFGAPLGLYWGEVRYYRMEGGTLTAGGSFCVSERGNLRAYKFDDFNGNGVQDTGEGPVAGVWIEIQPVPGSLCPGDPARQQTLADGVALWTNIAIGQYVVTELVPVGYEATLPISHTVAVTIDTTSAITFANRLPPSQVAGLVWYDPDADGVPDPGEAGLAGLAVRLYGDTNGNGLHDAGEPLLRQITTTATGAYTFTLLRAGDYVVSVDAADPALPLGLAPISPTLRAVTGLVPAETRRVNFNFRDTGAIGGLVWYDRDRDGVVDPGEGGLPAIAVCLYADSNANGLADPTDPLLRCADSDAGGLFQFSNLPGGRYVVQADRSDADLPPGMVPTTPDALGVTLLPGASQTVRFGFDDNGLIGGVIWNDGDGNGVIGAGEPPLPGVRVCLYGDLDADGVLDPTDTLVGCQDAGSTGAYEFTGLPGGSYISDVDQTDADLPAGWVLTTADPRPVVLPPGGSQTVNFGFRAPPTACIIGQKVDDLHVGLPGWTIHARPRDALTPTLTAVTDGQGNFGFAGLAPGWWTLWEEMQPGWAAVTLAQFDQELPPGPPCVSVRFKNRQACARDVYEVDDTFGAARLILHDGVPQKHTFEPPADLDWVAFDALAGRNYTLRTDNLLGDTDTELVLFAPDGVTPLAYSDDIVPGADPRSRIIWQAPASGRYLARVRDYYQTGQHGCLAYDLILTAQGNLYLPLLLNDPPPPPTPTPTPTLTPTLTPTITPTPTPTPTPTITPTPLPDISIPGLSHPKDIGVHRFTHRLYAASRNTNTLYEVNPLSGTVTRAIAVGAEPFGVGVNSTTNKVYVANYLGDSLSVINAATGVVIKTISFAPYGEPTYVAVNETTNRIYVPLHDGGRLAVIDGWTDTLLGTVETCGGAFGVAADPVLNRVYVSCRDARRIWVINGADNSILWAQNVWLTGMPYALGIDPSLGRLYVAYAPENVDPRQVLVYRIPAEGPSLLSAVLVGQGGPNGGGGIAANPLTHHVFVTNSAEDSVSVFDGVTLMTLASVPVGDDPQGVAVDPGLNYVFVGNRKSNTVSGFGDLFGE